MGRLWRPPALAEIAADLSGPPALLIRRAGHEVTRLRVDSLAWVMFIRIGDGFTGGEAAWWLLPAAPGAIAISTQCPGAEPSLRGPLGPALRGAGGFLLAELAAPPAALRHAPDGVAILDAAESRALQAGDPKAGLLRHVTSPQDFPVIT